MLQPQLAPLMTAVTSGSDKDSETANSGDGYGTALCSGNVHTGPVSAGQEDADADPSDSNSDSDGIGFECARWLAFAVGPSADSRGA